MILGLLILFSIGTFAVYSTYCRLEGKHEPLFMLNEWIYKLIEKAKKLKN